jgi:hypothetical protein
LIGFRRLISKANSAGFVYPEITRSSVSGKLRQLLKDHLALNLPGAERFMEGRDYTK